ncbi:SDR family oxidoreductase [uncultured Herbaspirillum sp.]|uniref:SDR family oxidoreductase n=1 Tax=uncultured Herbaspirillum sp. TaxID=160236 RepID=UPI002583F01D|nr:SDR family oxidoreductase [uncultured Herbaspirillum sp.]
MSAASTATLLAGRRILVTGAARGLGLAFVQAIAAAGASVAMADILQEELASAVARLQQAGMKVQGFALDLADPASVRIAAAAATQWLGGLDGLVNNAAITNSGGKSSEQLELEMWDRVMDVNVRGTWLMTNACLPALRASGRGAVVNLSSDTPLWGAPNLLAYVASKSAVIGMTRSLARELGADNITVNAVAPGLTLVEATQYVPQARHQHYLDGRAIQRDQLPEDVCGAVVFALSDLARFFTGQVMAVNGGFVMH